jgi:hypothetical protein
LRAATAMLCPAGDSSSNATFCSVVYCRLTFFSSLIDTSILRTRTVRFQVGLHHGRPRGALLDEHILSASMIGLLRAWCIARCSAVRTAPSCRASPRSSTAPHRTRLVVVSRRRGRWARFSSRWKTSSSVARPGLNRFRRMRWCSAAHWRIDVSRAGCVAPPPARRSGGKSGKPVTKGPESVIWSQGAVADGCELIGSTGRIRVLPGATAGDGCLRGRRRVLPGRQRSTTYMGRENDPERFRIRRPPGGVLRPQAIASSRRHQGARKALTGGIEETQGSPCGP